MFKKRRLRKLEIFKFAPYQPKPQVVSPRVVSPKLIRKLSKEFAYRSPAPNNKVEPTICAKPPVDTVDTVKRDQESAARIALAKTIDNERLSFYYVVPPHQIYTHPYNKNLQCPITNIFDKKLNF